MKTLTPKLAFIGTLLLLLGSCVKTLDTTWVIYEEEGCTPPWVSLKNDNNSRNNLESLLKAEGIIPLKIKIEGERDDSCNECACTTGKVYRVQIDESQLDRIYYYGFKSE